MEKSIRISKITINRLVSDIKKIRKDPLEDDNIYYKHDEENMLKGYAMIIGYKDTPYEYGCYFFEFNFPSNYPFSPPTLVFCTNDGETRFNPNLYKCGKVCLSVLNTWKGEQWTSCQTISSILLILSTVLNDKPLLNEPGIKEDHKDFDKYNKIIKFKNYKTALLKMVTKENTPVQFEKFYDIIKIHYEKNKIDILQNIRDLQNTDEIVSTSIYSMKVKVNYTNLLKSFEKLIL
jgi:ubiquitin-conjugating enzyme E2 Z